MGGVRCVAFVVHCVVCDMSGVLVCDVCAGCVIMCNMLCV